MKKALLCAAVLVGLSASLVLAEQKFSKSDRDMTEAMLRDIAADVKKYYYDPDLHGVDWDAKVRETKANLEKADSMDSAVSELAALLDSLKDSHTALQLPPRNHTHKYGFQLKMFGDHCYVVRVRPGSDAEKKGLTPGNEVLAINDYPVSRKNFWRIEYIFHTLRPQPGLRLSLRGDGATPRQVDVMAKVELSDVIKVGQHQGANEIARERDDRNMKLEPRFLESGDELLVVKLPQFMLSATDVDHVLGKMRKHKGVVLDLRDNPGGAVDTVDRFLGGMFENDLKICDHVSRTETKPVTVHGRHHEAYTGRLAVLVDSKSASASEIFARVVQLQHRAFVLGDRSSGMVMESVLHTHDTFYGWLAGFGVSVTQADLLMNDGKSLEHAGVEPDIIVLPTPQDLVEHRDPAMAKAAGLVGAKLTPEEAGAAFPDKDKDWDR